jgi:hypothetical protein
MATQKELAHCLGVTTRQIRYLLASGTLRKGMTPEEALAAYKHRRRKRTTPRSSEAVDEFGFTRRMRAELEAVAAEWKTRGFLERL